MSTTTTIQTIGSMRLARRRLDRQRREIERVTREMKAGATLHLYFANGRKIWSINGRFVPPDVAAVVIARPEVAAGGDALFHATSQTYTFREKIHD